MRSYLVGQPGTKLDLERTEHYAPASQVGLCFDALKKFTSSNSILDRIRAEYLSVILALRQMGVDFRILYGDETLLDRGLLSMCIRHLGCKLAGASGFWLPGLLFPRDLFMTTGSVALFNSEVTTLLSDRKDEYRLVATPFGQGGRVLVGGDVALLPERIHKHDKASRWVEETDITPLREVGLRTAKLPQPVGAIYTRDEITDRIFFNDHLDRSHGCLLQRQDGSLHLMIDSRLIVASWPNFPEAMPWEPAFPPDSLDIVKRACEPLGVVVHPVSGLAVPYSLNLIQFEDQRVLMTSGDEAAATAVAGIVGCDQLHLTEVPIVCYPVFAYAGIRCLVTEQPPTFVKVPNAPG